MAQHGPSFLFEEAGPLVVDRRREWHPHREVAYVPYRAVYSDYMTSTTEETARAHRVLSLGYEGKSAEDLVDHIHDLGVHVVVDVRQNAISRKAGLSKTRLRSALETRGIRYLHMRSLGNPKENRARFSEADPTRARETFRNIIENDAAAQSDLKALAAEVAEGPIALLCFEHEPDRCHRSVVEEQLLSRLGAYDAREGVRRAGD